MYSIPKTSVSWVLPLESGSGVSIACHVQDWEGTLKTETPTRFLQSYFCWDNERLDTLDDIGYMLSILGWHHGLFPLAHD